ncbi:HDR096Wp [Eremothecium sinecaudum]|uniref:HDR096Wp n=1 Tax=Eremothecium sinecaudum TaxID=45286 RepID=A0A109UZU0_9SACH|nr:HDR096Wp [Eremothecium sinecaudum]AMD20838.1 HDR096Wp [Eremothecium sinecaudum]
MYIYNLKKSQPRLINRTPRFAQTLNKEKETSNMFRRGASRVIQRAGYAKKPKVVKLRDLSDPGAIDKMDPRILRHLINMRTDQLNTQKEIKMINELRDDAKRQQPLSKTRKRLWLLALGGALAYLVNNVMTWKAEYDEKEESLQKQMLELETELTSLLADEKEVKLEPIDEQEVPSPVVEKRWYQRWFWR